MERDLGSVDLPMLRVLLAEEERELSKALLNGRSWDDLRDTRARITALYTTIHKRLYSTLEDAHPAATKMRNEGA